MIIFSYQFQLAYDILKLQGIQSHSNQLQIVEAAILDLGKKELKQLVEQCVFYPKLSLQKCVRAGSAKHVGKVLNFVTRKK